MAFSFGSTPTPAPAAPSTGGFSFGSAPAAPAAPAAPSTGGGGGFNFGSTPSAAAPSTNAPAPAAGGFSFGSSTPATGGFFGSTPAPAPTGGLFGSTPAPAPAGGLFGSTPAPSPAGGLFGSTAVAAPANQTQAVQHLPITANTPYKSLPPQAQKLIDDIYKLIHQHEQTMNAVATMQPASLQQQASAANIYNNPQPNRTDAADIAAGSSSSNTPSMGIGQSPVTTNKMSNKITSLESSIKEIKQSMSSFTKQTNTIFAQTNYIFQQTYRHAVYPLQSTAARHNLQIQQQLPELNNLLQNVSEIAKKLNAALMENMIHVDYVEGMPSVYLWNVLEEYTKRMYDLDYRLGQIAKKMNKRMENVQKSRERLHYSQNGGSLDGDGEVAADDLSQAIENHLQEFLKISDVVAKIHCEMDDLRKGYKDHLLRESFRAGGTPGLRGGSGSSIGIGANNGTGTMTLDPFVEADEREKNYERRLAQEAFRRRNEAAPQVSALPNTTTQSNTSTQAPTGGGLFGAPAPAPTGGLFGSTPAPSGGLFGAPSPAPATGGLFGSTTPAPAPTTGGLFGTPAPAAPAPTTGGLFGSTPGATPAPGGLFGAPTPAASAPAPTTSFSFGNPAPAPSAGGGLFGAAPAPATGGFGFGATSAPAAASSTTSRSRRKSGGRRR